MLFLPEYRLQKILSGLFDFLKTNLKENIAANTETKAFLYLYFNEDSNIPLESGNKAYYVQAKNILLREELDQSKVEIYPTFNSNRGNLPTVHICIPQESKGALDQIGDIEGDTYTNNTIKIERSFSAQFSILVTSSNMVEVLLISYILRGLLIGNLGLLDCYGFKNANLSLLNLELKPEILPPNIFVKGLIVEANYTEVVPDLSAEPTIITNIEFHLKELD